MPTLPIFSLSIHFSFSLCSLLLLFTYLLAQNAIGPLQVISYLFHHNMVLSSTFFYYFPTNDIDLLCLASTNGEAPHKKSTNWKTWFTQEQ